MSRDPHGVDALHEAWVDAMRAGDVERVLDLLDEDYVLLAPGAPPLEGREAVRPAMEVALQRFEIEASFEREARVVEGDLAVERGWDVQLLRPRAGGDEVTQRQRVMLVSRRGEDGRWRFLWGMSQSPTPQ